MNPIIHLLKTLIFLGGKKPSSYNSLQSSTWPVALLHLSSNLFILRLCSRHAGFRAVLQYPWHSPPRDPYPNHSLCPWLFPYIPAWPNVALPSVFLRNAILLRRPLLTFCLKLQPLFLIPSTVSPPQSVLILFTFRIYHSLTFFLFLMFIAECLFPHTRV